MYSYYYAHTLSFVTITILCAYSFTNLVHSSEGTRANDITKMQFRLCNNSHLRHVWSCFRWCQWLQYTEIIYLSGFLKLALIAQSKRMHMLSTKTMKTHNAKQTID